MLLKVEGILLYPPETKFKPLQFCVDQLVDYRDTSGGNLRVPIADPRVTLTDLQTGAPDGASRLRIIQRISGTVQWGEMPPIKVRSIGQESRFYGINEKNQLASGGEFEFDWGERIPQIYWESDQPPSFTLSPRVEIDPQNTQFTPIYTVVYKGGDQLEVQPVAGRSFETICHDAPEWADSLVVRQQIVGDVSIGDELITVESIPNDSVEYYIDAQMLSEKEVRTFYPDFESMAPPNDERYRQVVRTRNEIPREFLFPPPIVSSE